MSTLNVDEADAVLLLTAAETSGDTGLIFDGQAVPDGWVDTGTSTSLLPFVAGSSTPIDGTRDLYGNPARAATPSWDDINAGFGVMLSTWPVSGNDPDSGPDTTSTAKSRSRSHEPTVRSRPASRVRPTVSSTSPLSGWTGRRGSHSHGLLAMVVFCSWISLRPYAQRTATRSNS